MSAHAKRLKLRMFIEGVEVPIIACQVEVRPNSPLVATIQVPPLAEGTRLFPRSLVHIYFLDFYATNNPNVIKRGPNSTAGGQTNNPSAYEQEQGNEDINGPGYGNLPDHNNQQYKLLFVGETVGFSWTKNASNRSLVLQCLDLSNYWDYAYQWSNSDIFGPGIKALFSGGSTNLFTDFLSDEGSEILALIRKPSRTYPKLKGLLGGIVSALEGIGGTYYTQKIVGGQNIFFSLAELRLHITQMITAYEKDPTSANLMNAGGYDGLFGRTLGNLGAQVSFRMAINALQGMIFHETFGQSCPLFVPGTYGTTSGQVVQNLEDVQEAAAIVDIAKRLITGQNAEIFNLRGVASEAGDLIFSQSLDEYLSQFSRAAALCTKALQIIASLRIAEFDRLKPPFTMGRTLILEAQKKLKAGWGKSLDGPGEISSKVFDDVAGRLAQALAQFERVLNTQIPLTKLSDGVPARLNQQIFRPDVWFSAPPRCNVLFPDSYTNLQYTRAFLAEPTRFLLKTNDEFFGEDELFDNFFFAPKSPTVKKGDATFEALLNNDLMDHELFTGILPIFEKMGELNIFAAQSGTENGVHLKVGLAQRSTNFLYFKHRFSARQMQVESRFNPYIACGFPGLVVDRYVDQNVLARHNELLQSIGQSTRESRNLLGTHFLGNFTEVTHNVDQNSGRTSINVGYARQYEEATEFLGAIEASQTVKERFESNALRSTVVACLSPPPAGSLGPNFGVVTEAIDVTDAHVGDSDNTFPLYRGPRRKPDDYHIKVPIGITQASGDYGPDVAAFIGDDLTPVRFRAFEVYEEVPRYRTKIVDTPAEEYIRPGWYGPIWKPQNIGQVYDQFFKTGAITDPTDISDPQGSYVASPAYNAEDAVGNQLLGNPFTNAGTDLAIVRLDQNVSIAQAVEYIVLSYSYVKQAPGVNVDDFIMAYTWRPIASMIDMFGTSDLTLSTDGARVLTGYEGFHSRAFGPYDDLFGLVSTDVENALGIKRGANASKKADTRKRKQDAVLDFVSALQLSRAILG